MPSDVSRLGLSMGRFGAPSSAPSPPSRTAEAFAAVALAADAGVRLIDCPPDPEDAERILGQVLPRDLAFSLTLRTAAVEGGPEAVVRRLRTSIRRVRRERVDAVLARPASLLGEDGPKLWDALIRLKAEGVVGAVGMTACVCDDPVGLARRFRPDVMQLPLSLLDQRLLANGAIDEIAGRGVELHLRSIFSHGLLFFEDAALAAGAPHVSRVRRLLAEAGADPMQAALAFALSRPQASRVVVGVGSPSEVRAILKAAAAEGPQLDWEALRLDLACGAQARCKAA